jgi:hypothetical protein
MTDAKLLLIALCYLREQISDLNDANPDPIFKQAKSFLTRKISAVLKDSSLSDDSECLDLLWNCDKLFKKNMKKIRLNTAVQKILKTPAYNVMFQNILGIEL